MNKVYRLLWLLFVLIVFLCTESKAQTKKWKPVNNPILSRWVKNVTPVDAHNEYPRPQMKRKTWKNLNGLWQYAIRPVNTGKPTAYSGNILVPYPVESALSGVKKSVGPDSILWYHRTFELNPGWQNKEILIHFGAVDWRTTLWVNGHKTGIHQGGYNPFSYDITPWLKKEGKQDILIKVWDPGNAGYQPRGKQVEKPHSIWYTPTTGIWQTVWIEPVPEVAIKKLNMTPDIDNGTLKLTVKTTGNADSYSIRAKALDGNQIVAQTEEPTGQKLSLHITNAKLWSPDHPFLYRLNVSLVKNGQVVDNVNSYFGMRSISVGKDSHGFVRMMLNHHPVFEFGPLDQGFWPGGLYTAPTDNALKNDIKVMKELGFNMVRKHVKVEPARYYYWCDKLGLLVWQDMPSGDLTEKHKSAQSARDYDTELKAMIHNLYNHPSIIMWVPFNEGWGQFDTKRVVQLVQEMDHNRLVDDASGWTDHGVGNIIDMHKYPGPGVPDTEQARAAVLGEFGGLGLPIPGHTWKKQKNWSYHGYKNRKDLTRAYKEHIEKLKPLILHKGLSAAVYTQLTDIEVEINGLMTYDRAIIKEDTSVIAPLNRSIVRILNTNKY
jgi:beta-galactosidase/beta-glucuronidase